MADAAFKKVNTRECRICGRSFVPESLAKHEPICKKNAQKKRKVFDSHKQRAEGSDIPITKKRPTKEVKVPKSNWRAKHEDFIWTVRAARGATLAIQRGDPLPPPPPPSINPDYIECQYCSRRFNEKAAERHINFCREQQKKLPNKPKPNPTAMSKMNTRTSYQPPKPKTRASPGTTGYSPSTRGGPATKPMGNSTPSTGRVTGGVGRAPPGSNGYSRQPATTNATRGRSTLTTNTYQASDYGDVSPPGFEAPGRVLRTGRDGRAYLEAKRDMHTNVHGSPNSHYKRGVKHGNGSHSPGNIYYGGGLKESDTGYHSSSSETDNYGISHSFSRGDNFNTSNRGGKFCHECGSKYAVTTAKFCSECGIRRLGLT